MLLIHISAQYICTRVREWLWRRTCADIRLRSEDPLLTISKLKRWSINYYIDTAAAAERATADLQRAGGGFGEYYSEHETRTLVWLLAGDTRQAAALTGVAPNDARGAQGVRAGCMASNSSESSETT